MCGIAGIRRMGDKPIEAWQLQMLAASLEYRGNDATGFALMDEEGEIQVIKDHEPAWRFCSSKGFGDWVKEHLTKTTRVALVHTRKATVGTPFRNVNNHPMFAGKGAIVHNGYVSNAKAITDEFGASEAETDSDAIRSILDKEGRITPKIIRKMNKLAGGIAAACIHPASPGTVLLLRSGNPLVVGDCDGFLIWASDKRAIFNACKPWVQRHGIWMREHRPNIAMTEMNNDSAWIIDEDGLKEHGEFKAAGNWTRDVRYHVYDDYKKRRERHKEAAKPVGATPGGHWQSGKYLCGNEKCAAIIDMDEQKPALRRLPLTQIVCKACNTGLDKAKKLDDAATN